MLKVKLQIVITVTIGSIFNHFGTISVIEHFDEYIEAIPRKQSAVHETVFDVRTFSLDKNKCSSVSQETIEGSISEQVVEYNLKGNESCFSLLYDPLLIKANESDYSIHVHVKASLPLKDFDNQTIGFYITVYDTTNAKREIQRVNFTFADIEE